MNKSIIKVSLIVTLLLILIGTNVYAETGLLKSNLSYYITSDENGVQQVFQLLLEDEQQARQLTHANRDVITFGVAYDALGIVYISDGQLWLQPIHVQEAEALATVSATQFFSSPIFSQDGNYVAYADNGVWLYDLANRQTRQLLEDVPLAEMASNANEYRIYQPKAFVTDADGTVTDLVVDVGIWEWNTEGIYNLESNQFVELDGKLHTNILALTDGRALIYGNNGVDGEGSLYVAESLETINRATPVLYFHELTEAVLFADQAVEIESDVVRVFGSAITFTPSQPDDQHFHFDFNINTGAAEDVQLMKLATTEESNYTVVGELSSTGNVIPVHMNTQYTDEGSIYGAFKLVNLLTGESIPAPFPDVVGVFRLQP